MSLKALNSYLEDLEDTYLAIEVLKNPGKIYSMDELAQELEFSADERKEIGMDD